MKAEAEKLAKEQKQQAEQEEQAKLAAEQQQKKEDEEKAAEEKAAAVEEKAAEEEAAAKDSPDDNINEHLNELNSGGRGGGNEGGRDDEEVMDEEAAGQMDGSSPPRKRSKKSKKSKKDARRERKERSSAGGRKRSQPEPAQGQDPKEGGEEPPGTPSSLRQGRWSSAGSTPGRKATTATTVPPHDHIHKRVFGEGSKILTGEDKHTELVMGLRMMLKEAQKVDPHFAIMPCEEEDKGPILAQPNEIPLNHTDLSANIRFPRNVSFKKKKPWGRGTEDVAEEDYIDPEVRFSFVFSCDKEPSVILGRIRQEWTKHGGRWLGEMELPTHDPKGAVVLYHVHNEGHEPTLIEEIQGILKRACEIETEEAMGAEGLGYRWAHMAIPRFTLALKVPMIPGQDTKKLDKLPWKMKNQRKALHITTDGKDVQHIQELMTAAKSRNLVEPILGKQARPSNVIVTQKDDKNRTRSFHITSVKSYTRRHVNYHASMMMVNFPGIWDLDKQVPFYNVVRTTEVEGFLTLRTVFYTQLKLLDGHSFIAEIHQQHAMADVEAAIPNINESETMCLMMNKNIVAYLTHYLQDAGMDKTFVKELLKESCDPSLFHSVPQCTWDKKTRVLTTPEDKEREKEKKLEDAAWYNNAFGEMMDSPKKGGRGGKEKNNTLTQRICTIWTTLTQ